MLPPEPLELQRRCNRQSADRWSRFAEHRLRVTALTLTAGGDTLAVLGAGNGNDLDLPALTAQFKAVHLADLDDEAVARARARQPAAVARRLVLHAPVDLSGALPRLPALRDCPPDDATLAALPAAATEAIVAALPGGFDVVLSAGLLSQILHGCTVALGARHPSLGAVSCALVLAHVRALGRLLRPGGTALLVTDIASSESCPLEELWARSEPRALAHALEEARLTASGTGPGFLRRLCADDPVLTPLLREPPQLLPPWLWRFGDRLSYLVTGWVLRRR